MLGPPLPLTGKPVYHARQDFARENPGENSRFKAFGPNFVLARGKGNSFTGGNQKTPLVFIAGIAYNILT
jgi:hypothetical protein